MKVKNIYKGIVGMGEWAGFPSTFIELPRSYSDSFKEILDNQILTKVIEFGFEKVTLIWHDEMIPQDDLIHLVDKLLIRGYEVNIQTGGTVKLMKLLKLRTMNPLSKLVITLNLINLDNSIGTDKTTLINLTLLDSRDSVVFHVGNNSDLHSVEWLMRDTVRPFLSNHKLKLFIVLNNFRMAIDDIISFLLDKQMNEIRFQHIH